MGNTLRLSTDITSQEFLCLSEGNLLPSQLLTAFRLADQDFHTGKGERLDLIGCTIWDPQGLGVNGNIYRTGRLGLGLEGRKDKKAAVTGD